MSTTVDLNNNTSACIQTVSNIGNNTYQNICNNTSHIVSWGSGDWILFFFVIAIIVAGIIGIIAFTKFIKEDY